MSPWRRTFYAAWWGQFLAITGFFFVMPLLPLYIQELHPGMAEADLAVWSGRIRAVTGLTMAVFAPIWGFLADRYGRKPMVLRSMLCGALLLILMGFARNVTDLLFLRILQGVVTGTMTATIALVSSVTPRERSGYTLGMVQAAVFAGAVFGPWIGGEVAESCGFRPAFFIGAAMLVLGALLVWRFVREDFVRPERSDKGRFASLMEVLGTTAFLAAIVSLFLVRFGNSSFQPVFPYLLREVLGTDEGLRALTGRIIGVAGLAAAVSAWFLSRVSDRWGHKRLLLVSIAVAGIATLGLAVARTIPHFYMLRALFGLAVAGIMPSASAIIRKVIHEKHLGKAYGIQASVTGLGWGIGSLSGGYVAAVWGLRAPFILTAVVLFVTIVFVARRVR